jgi:hypothetical protein
MEYLGYCQLNGNCRVISSGFNVKVGHEPVLLQKKAVMW